MESESWRRAAKSWRQADGWRARRLARAEGSRIRGWKGALGRTGTIAWAMLWKGWVGVAAVLALLIDGVSTGLGIMIEGLDGTIGWLFGVAAAPIELVLALPYLGRGLSWLWSLLLSLVWAILSLPDLLLVLIGVLPEKRLRLWIAVPDAASFDDQDWLTAMAVAAEVFRREANVRLVPAFGFQWQRAFSQEKPFRGETLRANVVAGELAGGVGCQLRAAKEDLGWAGTSVAINSVRHHLRGGARRITGWGAPLMAVAVESVEKGKLAGCSLGPLTDYVTVRADQPVCLAHELGHACNLPHSQAPTNLMNPTCGGVHLNRWQVAALRLSRHVTYL